MSSTMFTVTDVTPAPAGSTEPGRREVSRAAKVGEKALTGAVSWYTVLIAAAAVAIATAVAGRFVAGDFNSSTPESAPVEGLTIFAVFFVGAQALERAMEPFALWLGMSTKAEAAVAAVTAQKAADDENGQNVEGLVQAAANAKAKAAAASNTRVVLFWTFATCAAIVLSATFHLHFLSAVGLSTPNIYMEILGTGLILGAGTKPLHDLITLIEKKKQAAEADSAG